MIKKDILILCLSIFSLVPTISAITAPTNAIIVTNNSGRPILISFILPTMYQHALENSNYDEMALIAGIAEETITIAPTVGPTAIANNTTTSISLPIPGDYRVLVRTNDTADNENQVITSLNTTAPGTLYFNEHYFPQPPAPQEEHKENDTNSDDNVSGNTDV